MCEIVCPAVLDVPNHRQKLRRRYVSNRTCTKVGEEVRFEPAQDVRRVCLDPHILLFRIPLARNSLKGVSCLMCGKSSIFFPLQAWVDLLRQELLRFFTRNTRLGERHRIPLAKREQLLLATETVLETPELAASRRNLEIQAAGVPQAKPLLRNCLPISQFRLR